MKFTRSINESQQEVIKMVGKNLKALREERGVTQQQLADAIDVKPQYISAVERDVRRLSAEQVAVFAELLGCSTDDIILGKDRVSA